MTAPDSPLDTRQVQYSVDLVIEFTLFIGAVSEPPLPTLDVECHKNIDSETGLLAVGIHWRLAYNSSLDGPYNSTTALELSLESIEQYQINIEIIKVLENGTFKHIRWEAIDFVVIPVSCITALY